MIKEITAKLKGKNIEDYKRVSYALYKDIYYKYLSSSVDTATQQLLFILGCQRSGSSMMYEIFSKDNRTKVFGEVNYLNSNDTEKRLRLNPLPEVKASLSRYQHPIIVLKPIVESQNVLQLLSTFDNSQAVWLFRHYADVAQSNIKRWGAENGHRNIQYMLSGDQSNWRAQHVSPTTFDTVQELVARREWLPHDYAALFWWVRNRIYVEKALYKNGLVFTCKYEKLVANPVHSMCLIYDFMAVDMLSDKVVAHIHPRSVGKGSDIPISPEIKDLCEQLLETLNACAEN
ncbi:MAG: sulfotransferase domain-containing protein [Bacteroidota bacterium]